MVVGLAPGGEFFLNAAEHSAAANIEVRVERAGDLVRGSVRDDGCGMPCLDLRVMAGQDRPAHRPKRAR